MYAQEHDESLPTAGGVWKQIKLTSALTDNTALAQAAASSATRCPNLTNKPNGYVYNVQLDNVNLGDTRITDPTSVTLITDGQHASGAANVAFSLADVATTRHANNFITAALDGHVTVFRAADTTWNNGGLFAIPATASFINNLTGTGDSVGMGGSLSYTLDSEVSWTCPGATVTPTDASMKATITFPATGTYTVTANTNPAVTRTVYVTDLNIVTTAPNPAAAGTAYSYTLKDGAVNAGGTFMWEYQKSGDPGWTAVVGGTTNPASIALPGVANVTSTYSVRCTSSLLVGFPVQSSPITVAAIPPATVSMVSFGLPSGPNWTSGTNTLNAYQNPSATETVVNWNSFTGSPAAYFTAPTFVGVTQIVASGIAGCMSGTYAITLNNSVKTFGLAGGSATVYTSGSTSTINIYGSGSSANVANNHFIRTVAAAETRYAYIYYVINNNNGGAATTNATLTSKILDATGATIVTDTQDVTSTCVANGNKVYMAKVRYYGGANGVNLDVKFSVTRGSTWADSGCAAVIITK